VYDQAYQDKHLERIKKDIKYIDRFLAGAEERKGAGGEEVKSHIPDTERAKIQGAHGYIQGYKGIAVAEAFGSGSESGHFPAMLDELSERMGALRGGSGAA
jgi:hypothetical protein